MCFYVLYMVVCFINGCKFYIWLYVTNVVVFYIWL